MHRLGDYKKRLPTQTVDPNGGLIKA